MQSPYAEQAVADALQAGRAIVKFVSRNDVGDTGGHQCGFYLPIKLWRFFTQQPPEKGKNHKSLVNVLWQNGYVTESAVTWYGKGTRHEYRLTRFGKDFPYLTPDNVGSLLVLIPEDFNNFRAYVLDFDEDIEAVQTSLGIQILTTWGAYDKEKHASFESENQCIDRHFRAFVEKLVDFPKSHVLSDVTRQVADNCIKKFNRYSLDTRLMTWVEMEYQVFRMLERKICQDQVTKLFKDVDDFVSTAASIMNRRKARAGNSLENHVEFLLRKAGVPFDLQARVDGRPDILIPSAEAYNDSCYPEAKIFVLGLKTTCKDRWRQVLNEGKRVKQKHILTLQPGISRNQLQEMKSCHVSLIVPQGLHKDYALPSGTQISTVTQFVEAMKKIRF